MRSRRRWSPLSKGQPGDVREATVSGICFSTYSISTALAMTYAGSAGATQKQMAETLHFTGPEPQLTVGWDSRMSRSDHCAFGPWSTGVCGRERRGHGSGGSDGGCHGSHGRPVRQEPPDFRADHPFCLPDPGQSDRQKPRRTRRTRRTTTEDKEDTEKCNQNQELRRDIKSILKTHLSRSPPLFSVLSVSSVVVLRALCVLRG